ncbi:MAG: hypothetical protein MGF17_06955 [Trichodesmium sp. MAG_R04]|nr:hypothetical protein [Trichodesmium sp. MAG_R04]
MGFIEAPQSMEDLLAIATVFEDVYFLPIMIEGGKTQFCLVRNWQSWI